jgi:hypothetical protein
VDERQLAELFRAAADDGPPAGFGHAEVVAASRRATARRRASIAGGSVLAVAVLFGGVAVGGGLFSGGGGMGQEATSAGGGAQMSEVWPVPAQEGVPEIAPNAEGPTQLSVPDDRSQGTGTSGKVVPWPGLGDDDARAGCGQADRELAEALAAQLPAANSELAEPVPDGCPPQARAVAVPVEDGGTTGWIYVVLAPVGGSATDVAVQREDGARGHQVLAASGQVLVVLSVPSADGGRPPFGARTSRIAEALRNRF